MTADDDDDGGALDGVLESVAARGVARGTAGRVPDADGGRDDGGVVDDTDGDDDVSLFVGAPAAAVPAAVGVAAAVI